MGFSWGGGEDRWNAGWSAVCITNDDYQVIYGCVSGCERVARDMGIW